MFCRVVSCLVLDVAPAPFLLCVAYFAPLFSLFCFFITRFGFYSSILYLLLLFYSVSSSSFVRGIVSYQVRSLHPFFLFRLSQRHGRFAH